MSEQPIDIIGYTGVDPTTDPYILGKKDNMRSALSYNYRAKNGIRSSRGGYQPVFQKGATDPTIIPGYDVSSVGFFKKSGVYFPHGSKAILPHTSVDYNGSFYLASTGASPQSAFSIEFWYKADYQAFDRTICKIPINFSQSGDELTEHMHVEFIPLISLGTVDQWSLGKTLLKLTLFLGDGGTPENVGQCSWISRSYIETDGEWHHIAITRTDGSVTPTVYRDGGDAMLMDMQFTVDTAFDGDEDFPLNATFQENHASPLYYNHIEIGGNEISLADFRIWSDARSAGEVLANYQTELAGTEANLICYVPFNEGTGKHFTESVNSVRGYFTPQEPYVNDDYELIFTGHNCMAFPSRRAKYRTWAVSSREEDAAVPVLKNCNEDAAYDGGILWDKLLRHGAGGIDYYSAASTPGVWRGVAQIRLVLRQLKEGVICGRLGLTYDTGDDAYRLFFADETNDIVYMSDAVVDDDWIGVEKTITVFYTGDDDAYPDPYDRCYFYVDDTEVTDSSQTSTEAIWANGVDILNTSIDKTYEDIDDSVDESAGALGGSTITTEMCIAFDVIFFRQWWDLYHDTSLSNFVAATYNVNILPDKFRIFMSDLDGYFVDGTRRVEFQTDISGLMGSTWDSNLSYMFLRMPIHFESDIHSMAGSGVSSYISLDSTGNVFNQSVVIRHVHDWDTDDNKCKVLPDDEIYQLSPCFKNNDTHYRYFNGAILSNLVNCYDQNTFKFNQEERPYFNQKEDDGRKIMELRICNSLRDDSPLQSVEKMGSALYDSRYLILATDDRNNTIYNMKSLKPRWCEGPHNSHDSDESDREYIGLRPLVLPAVRGIHRYTSEDGKIDKLLVVAWNSVWTMDPDTGELEQNEWGWMDRNSDEPVNFVVINNRLVIMDSKEAIKLNHKGNFSRLGVERPVDIAFEATEADDTPVVWEGVKRQYGYVAQFEDTENGSRSGTIPVIADQDQSVKLKDTANFNNIEVSVRSSKDKNIDRCRVYRTIDMTEGEDGDEQDLYLVKKTGNTTALHDWNTFQDVWDDTRLISQSADFLDPNYLGMNLVPPACKAMAVAYNRLFLFNNTEAKTSLFWSDLDSLGFGIPDQVSSVNSMIVEEGGTAVGTGLIEYSSQLFAFKEDAIFRIYEAKEGVFGSELVYKGVGAVNQRCLLIAGNAIYFLDKNGLYAYAGGEPVMVNPEMVDFYKEEVDQDNLDNSFMLYDKNDDQIMVFVPMSGSTYCDLCIIYRLKDKTVTIDLVPSVTCGYVDDEEIYVGTPYGKVLKYDKDIYVDVMDDDEGTFARTTGQASCTATTLSYASFAYLRDDFEYNGAPAFIQDPSSYAVWMGIITSKVNNNTVNVDRWRPLFNTTGAPTYSTAKYDIYIGYLFYYDKSPRHSFLNDHWGKNLKTVDFLTRTLGTDQTIFTRFTGDQTTNDHVATHTLSGDRTKTFYFGGMNRNFQFESAAMAIQALKIIAHTFHLVWTRGEQDHGGT